MHIIERNIMGYNILDISEALVNLNPKEREQYRKEQIGETKLWAAMYIYEAMKKIKGNGCVLAAHHFG
jgi:hypothetical protein